ncbi:hypothetical protein PRVXH_001777 [Proteinivorax hydrogeniformans]|uniref:Lipoprotein n=1 Tax=Proteinivorax hydrogeniformans TaxID=1826727 RepID=A0AAU8HQP0_9FIRM
MKKVSLLFTLTVIMILGCSEGDVVVEESKPVGEIVIRYEDNNGNNLHDSEIHNDVQGHRIFTAKKIEGFELMEGHKSEVNIEVTKEGQQHEHIFLYKEALLTIEQATDLILKKVYHRHLHDSMDSNDSAVTIDEGTVYIGDNNGFYFSSIYEVGNKTFYRFEDLERKDTKGAISFLCAQTGELYLEHYLSFISGVDITNFEYEMYMGEKIYAISVDSTTLPSEEKVDRLYYATELGLNHDSYDLITEFMVPDVISNDPVASLLNQKISEVEEKTGGELIEQTEGYGNVVKGEKFQVFFAEPNSNSSLIALEKGAEIFGARVGKTFDEIEEILGKGADRYIDTHFGVYVMQYEVVHLTLYFYSETEDGPTATARIS